MKFTCLCSSGSFYLFFIKILDTARFSTMYITMIGRTLMKRYFLIQLEGIFKIGNCSPVTLQEWSLFEISYLDDGTEMVECMKKVAKLDLELTVEERNLLSVGYKNVIGARRASWRIMSSIEQKEESKGNEHNVKLIKSYRQKVEEELCKICSDILAIIDKHLIPSSTSGEATVFYYKMWVTLLLGYVPSFCHLLDKKTHVEIQEII